MSGLATQNAGGVLTQQTLATIQLMAAGIFPTQGNVWFVSPGTGDDNNPGTAAAPFKTLSFALSMAVAGQNDIIYLLAHSNTTSQTTNYRTSTLDWNKDMVHLIGVNAGPFLGQRSRIAPLGTATSFANLFKVSANGCLIQNIEFFQGAGSTTLGTAQTCVLVSGQRNVFRNCQISGIGDATLDATSSNDLTITGSENLFQHCYIGLDTVIRTSCLTGVIFSGTPARNIFEDCQFVCYTSSTSYKLVTVPTGADRFIKFKSCEFSATPNITSSAAPSGAIAITTMNGAVQVMNCGFFNITQIVTADNAYVKVLAFNGLATGNLIGIAQGVDAA
jgi:hypothetical protein